MKHVLILFSVVLMSQPVFAQETEVKRQQHFWLDDEVALEGYDPVSYFDGKPSEGEETFRVVHRGITYYFSSQANKERFESEPAKYEPAYGGWCAYAISNGKKMDPDPETYLIQDGKLYLFFNGFFSNTLPKWKEDPKGLQAKADGEWYKIAAE